MAGYVVKVCNGCGKHFRMYLDDRDGLCPYCWAERESHKADDIIKSYGGVPNKAPWYPKHIVSYTLPSIKNVIFNKPATIILWRDGTKTVVKCKEGDTYDEEKGFVMAYIKKILGNDNTFHKVIKQWVKPEEVEAVVEVIEDIIEDAAEKVVAKRRDNMASVANAIAVTAEEVTSGKILAVDLENKLKGVPEIKPGDDGYSDIHPVEDDGK